MPEEECLKPARNPSTVGQAFRRRRRIHLWTILIALVLMIIVAWIVFNFSSKALQAPTLWAVLGILLVCLLVDFVNWRCPFCHEAFSSGFFNGGQESMNPRMCDKCGTKFW